MFDRILNAPLNGVSRFSSVSIAKEWMFFFLFWKVFQSFLLRPPRLLILSYRRNIIVTVCSNILIAQHLNVFQKG